MLSVLNALRSWSSSMVGRNVHSGCERTLFALGLKPFSAAFPPTRHWLPCGSSSDSDDEDSEDEDEDEAYFLLFLLFLDFFLLFLLVLCLFFLVASLFLFLSLTSVADSGSSEVTSLGSGDLSFRYDSTLSSLDLFPSGCLSPSLPRFKEDWLLAGFALFSPLLPVALSFFAASANFRWLTSASLNLSWLSLSSCLPLASK